MKYTGFGRELSRVFSYLYNDHSKCFFILSYPGCVAKCARILRLGGMADFRPIFGPLTPKWYNDRFRLLRPNTGKSSKIKSRHFG